jgi:hypothetical protein
MQIEKSTPKTRMAAILLIIKEVMPRKRDIWVSTSAGGFLLWSSVDIIAMGSGVL